MSAKPVIAVDFGTSNTYVAKCLGDQPTPEGIDFGDGRDGLATAILYRTDKEPIIGYKALEEFGEAEEERLTYTIRTQFKPDIAQSTEARKNSCDFLLHLLKQSANILQPAASQVIFGVPSEASTEYRETLKTLASEAGFGEIRVIDEPKGAIYFHVQRKDITPTEATQGALVVDFGGGTCDFALVVKGEVKHSWGDMHLGGRLFDDLFYQWFIEQCPDAVEDMQAEHAEFFTLWSTCREVKEKFSQKMAINRTEKFRKKVGDFGRITGVTWEEFLDRANEYRPSTTFVEYLKNANPGALDRFSQNGGVDILDWFRQSLCTGLQHEQVRQQQISCVVLTGGSSSWPFVKELVQKELTAIGISPRLVRSARPYATISQGLSIIPALQLAYNAIREKLRIEMPIFIKDRISPLVERRIQDAAGRIADSIAIALFDERIKPILLEFRHNGGAISSLKLSIAQQSEAFRPQIKTIVEQELGRVFTALPFDIVQEMSAWFKQHDLVFQHNAMHLEGANMESNIAIPVDVYDEIEKIITWVSISITTALMSMISGGAGTALIATGPIGLVIGAIIGLVVGALVITEGLAGAKHKAENWNCPAWIMNKALTNTKIDGIRADIKQQAREQTLRQINNAKRQLEQHIQQYVNLEIEVLSAISQM